MDRVRSISSFLVIGRLKGVEVSRGYVTKSLVIIIQAAQGCKGVWVPVYMYLCDSLRCQTLYPQLLLCYPLVT